MSIVVLLLGLVAGLTAPPEATFKADEPWPATYPPRDKLTPLPEITKEAEAYVSRVLPAEYTFEDVHEIWDGSKWNKDSYKNKVISGIMSDAHDGTYFSQEGEDILRAMGGNKDYCFSIERNKKDAVWHVMNIASDFPHAPDYRVGLLMAATMTECGYTSVPVLVKHRAVTYTTAFNADGTLTLKCYNLSRLQLGKPTGDKPLAMAYTTVVLDPKRHWVVLSAQTAKFTDDNQPYTMPMPWDKGKDRNQYNTSEVVNTYGEWRGMPVLTKQVDIQHEWRDPKKSPEREQWIRRTIKFEWRDFDKAKLPQTRLSYYGLSESATSKRPSNGSPPNHEK